jgi:formylglycine-generating enzyme required for sulfatase activity
MGSSTGGSDEQPVHSVTLSAFRMGATPVTVAVWKEYCAATGTELPEAPDRGLLDDHPVVNVSWNDIMGVDGKGGFCAWASIIAGFRLTLPTEAQFEYAARGGKRGLEYPWGNTFADSKLWCSTSTDRKSTASVTRSSNIFRNAYGLTDMSGNVWQWCSDLYGPYSGNAQNDPLGPSSTSDKSRCVRGGSWSNGFPGIFRCADRVRDIPGLRYFSGDVGFRLSAGPG